MSTQRSLSHSSSKLLSSHSCGNRRQKIQSCSTGSFKLVQKGWILKWCCWQTAFITSQVQWRVIFSTSSASLEASVRSELLLIRMSRCEQVDSVTSTMLGIPRKEDNHKGTLRWPGGLSLLISSSHTATRNFLTTKLRKTCTLTKHNTQK